MPPKPPTVVQPAPWREKLSFIAPTGTTSIVAGQEVEFFPISVKLAFRLKSIAVPILGALADVLSDDKALVGRTMKDFGTDDRGNVLGETIVTPLSVEAAEFLTSKRHNATEKFVGTLLDEKNKLLAGDVIVDSCHGLFPDKMSPTDIQDMVDGLDAPTFLEFMQGVIKANKKILDPFLSAVPQTIKDTIRRGTSASEAAE